MKKLASIFLAIASMTMMYKAQAAPSAQSQQRSNYVQLLAGPNWLNIREPRHKNIDLVTRNTGIMAGIAIGYRFCNGLRLEEEYSYRQNRVIVKKDLCVQGKCGNVYSGKAHTRAHTQTSAVLANLIWELPINCCRMTPYLGGGAGFGWNTARAGGRTKVSICGNKINVRNCHRRHSTQGFAWQGIAGFSFPVGCHADLALEYRYFRSTSNLRNSSVVVASKYNY